MVSWLLGKEIEVVLAGLALFISCRVGLNGEAPSDVAGDGLDDRSANTISLLLVAC